MAFKWILAPILAAFLTAAVPVPVHKGSDIAGTVPQLLTAVSDKDARNTECSLGDAVADAVRMSLGTDIAIVCGGDLIHNLLPGEITYDGLKAVFKEDRPLATAGVTPTELRAILESGLSHITLDKTESIDKAASIYDGFPQISGFTLSYDASAPPGQRVHEVRLNGRELDLSDDKTVLSLAATGFMLGGGYDLPAVKDVEPVETTLSGAMSAYLGQKMPDYLRTGFRIYPMGAQDGSFKTMFPIGIALVVILIIVLGNGQRFKRMNTFTQ